MSHDETINEDTLITLTLKEQVDSLPEESVATVTTFVIPAGKNDPEAGVDTNVTKQLSVTSTAKFTMAPQAFASVLTIVSEGQIIVGS